MAVETYAKSFIEVTIHCACRARDYNFAKLLTQKFVK
jgi:hypothetical protein